MADSSTSDWSPWSLAAPLAQAGAGIYAGIAGGNAVGNAYNAAGNTIQGAVNTSGAYLSPYANGGAAAAGAYENLLGIGGQTPNFAAFTNSPGYQFQQQQGEQAIQRAANANGNGFSTTTLAGLAKYDQGLASTQYQQYLQNLFGLTQTGAGAASAAGAQAITGAGAVGNAQVGQGLARNAGTNSALSSVATAAGKLPWQSIGNYFNTPNTSQANADATGVVNDYSSNFSVPSIYGNPNTYDDASGVTTYFGDNNG